MYQDAHEVIKELLKFPQIKWITFMKGGVIAITLESDNYAVFCKDMQEVLEYVERLKK